MAGVKQLISRIDDELHRRLKERAAAEERSVNDLVIEVLEAAVQDDADSWRRWLERRGLVVYPPPVANPPSMEELLRASRGTGSAVSEALQDERNSR